MGRKYIGLLSITAAVFGISGLIVGNFVSLPTFKASGEGDHRAPQPYFGVIKPFGKTTYAYKELDLISTKNSNPYSCPPVGNWTPNPEFFEEMPGVPRDFYLNPAYPLELIPSKREFQGNGSLVGYTLNRESQESYGNKNVYSQPRVESRSITSQLRSTERLRIIPNKTKYYVSNLEVLGGFYSYFLLSDIAGPLSDGITHSKVVTLCTKATHGGPGGDPGSE